MGSLFERINSATKVPEVTHQILFDTSWPELTPTQVVLWDISLDTGISALSQFSEVLSSSEHERAERFHNSRRARQYIVAHGVLRLLLSGYTGISPRDLIFNLSSLGKPALPNHEIEFSISHSGDALMLAFARGRRVGIDVEAINPRSEIRTLAPRIFSRTELADMEILPPANWEFAFYQGWVLKEAYLKACGDGLSRDLREVRIALTSAGVEPAEWTLIDGSWSARSLAIPDAAAALVVEGTDWTLRRSRLRLSNESSIDRPELVHACC